MEEPSRPGLAIVSKTHPATYALGSLKPSHQDKQEHNRYEPKLSATMVARTIEARTADPPEGIAKAKADGKYRGRQPTARSKTSDVLRLKAEGKSANDIRVALGISRASVFRILAENPQE